ncbi:subtilisin-like protein [Choiromyces venosus 120613-1]|uniref:Subtilisin-like protein n=1 Tax=Choiromyces venosus 120613-1 TaxID=1336337 RepID=A0A3N4K4L8_9PEZI|nr:subtilisin-like protein [Choiromyces venosus 120613-1]
MSIPPPSSFVTANHLLEALTMAGLDDRLSVLSAEGIEVTPQVNITSMVFFGASFTIASDDENIPAEIAELFDTGIDYNHPSLGGGFGPEFKVVGGADIVGDNYQGTNFSPDPDPYDCGGHGTHVAGIVAAEDKNFIGVAPKSKLLAYKVFGCIYDGTGEDALIQAFVQACEDGADVINASIGGPEGFPEDAWAIASSRIVQQGVFVAISAGNSGDRGLFYASSGATGVDVMSVASIANEEYFAFNTEAIAGNGTKRDIPYLQSGVEGFKLAGPVPVYVTSLDKFASNDACTALPENTPDLSEYLVVVRRGDCQFNIKEKNLVDKGATYIWFYNTLKTPIVYPNIEESVSLGYAMITQQDGEFIVEQIANGGNVTVNFPHELQGVGVSNTLTGRKMSPFTSWGPSFEAQIKSEIGAPGGYIYSTIPLKQGSYAVFSGTSMAPPYIAGIATLYMGKFGSRQKLGYAGVLELKTRMMASGTLVNWNDDTKTDPKRLAPVPQQDAGYVNALKVLTYKTTLSPGKLELNDTANFQPEHTITIQNSGQQEVIYTFSHEVAGTVNTFKRGSKVPQTFPPTFATLQFSPPQNITILARSSGTFKITFTPPKNLKTNPLPVYSGKVVLTSYEETLSIPYQGIHGNLGDVHIWETEQFPMLASYRTGEDIREPFTVSLTGGDLLTAVFANNFGTPEIRWDVVAEN